MKTIVARVSMVCISLIIFGLIISSLGYTKIDPKSIVGMWTFDEEKGDIAKDSSGNGHDGKLLGNPKWVAGKFGKAFEFDGTNGVQVEHSDDLSLTTFTVQAWIKLEKGGVWQQIVAKHNTPPRNYTVGVSPSNLVECAFTAGGSYKTALGKTPVADGQWHHVAGTYDKKFIRVYVDGALEDEKPETSAPEVNTASLEFGSGDGEPVIGGIIDEVRICNIALTKDEIKKSMGGIAAVKHSGKLATVWGNIKVQY